ncbi:hypothetical protein BDV32DRAFT_157365 [Aspergillus pseudonomiae]|nr:hypothetical protein BDV32DRAFT_157365 [Aspergillus pseudonomiae]
MTSTKSRPTFAELPLNPNDPPYSAWGLWGADDEVGTLDLLDESTVTRAANARRHTREFSHNVYEHSTELIAIDDELHFNMQKSSQVDGLRHFAYQKSDLCYNAKSKDNIQNSGSLTLGIQQWHGNGLVTGRGILIHYWAYAKRHDKVYDATGGTSITYDELMGRVAEQSQLSKQIIEVRRGDILLIRSGFTNKYVELSDDQEGELTTHNAPQDMWDGSRRENAAVPLGERGGHGGSLIGWLGCPIGELLWLEHLARACGDHKKWTFFLTSTPLNVPGGVSNPAKMIAIL